jgi:phospholipase/carboxylesterase
MRAWYDIKALALHAAEDGAGIRESAAVVEGYMVRAIEAGITAERIVLAGFSQGGAIALHTALRYPVRLAGVLALSTYLPQRDSFAKEASPANCGTPILMCHGQYDPVLPLQLGVQSRDLLLAQGYTVEWKEYPMQHEVCREEVNDIAGWLRSRLA